MSILFEPGLVTVIVASYNHARFLEERMDSLVKQTYHNIEILVIDDCSNDTSIKILKKYASYHNFRLIIHNKNVGFVATSNRGVELSKGEFILFAQTDDSCDIEMIEHLVKSMLENPTAGIAYCRSMLIDEFGNLLGDDFSDREKSFKNKCKSNSLLTKKEMSHFLLNSCVIPNLSAALFRKNCYISSGRMTPLFRVCLDWDLFFRVVKYFDVAYVAKPLNNFRQHKTSIRSGTKGRILYREIISLLLIQISKLDLKYIEHIRYRYHVMYLWASFILRPSRDGFLSFVYLMRVVLELDAIAIFYLPLALSFRLITLPMKTLNYLYKKYILVRNLNDAKLFSK